MLFSRLPSQRVRAPHGDESSPLCRHRQFLHGSLAKVLAGLSLAALITVGVEVAYGLGDPWPEPLTRLLELEPKVIGIGVLVVWAVIAFLHAVTARLWIAASAVTVLAVLVGFANYFKLQLRGEPLFVSDATYLTQTGFLLESVGVGPILAFSALLLGIPLAMWVMARVRRSRGAATEASPGRRGRVITRVVAGTAAATVLFSAATFNVPGNAARGLYEAAGVDWRPWNQAQNYDDNGVIAGLLYNLPSAPMDTPDGYSKETMEDLAERWTEASEELNADRDPAALEDTNIVLVLSESLSDPLALPSISADEDPLPFLRELMAENTSGTLQSGGYGGGTSNVEFEVVTGMSVANLRPQVDSPFPGLVAQSEEFPSHLRTLGGQRSTYALHPYHSEFYRRNAVYPALGIERMDFQDTLRGMRKLPGDKYVSDAAVYNRVVEELAASEEPMLVNVVTMQNHGPQEGLADPITVDGPLSDAEAATAGQYLRGLKHSDDALRQLTEDLEELEEPTIVLLYGDHLPSVWPEEVLAEGGTNARYETPWVVFANFETEQHSPGTVGANQLMNQVLDAAGAPHSPWTALLHELATEVPAMERTGWLDADGNPIVEADLTERGRELLHDYRLAQYDMAAGDGWVTDELLTTPEG